MTAPPRILVLGLGNPDRGDDALGPLVAGQLAGRLPPNATVAARGGDVLGLLDDWADCDALICIDAAASLGTPGRVHRIDLADGELPRALAFASTHALGLPDALALGRRLGRLPPTVVVYAVEAESFAAGTPVSPRVAAAAAFVAARVVADVARLAAGA